MATLRRSGGVRRAAVVLAALVVLAGAPAAVILATATPAAASTQMAADTAMRLPGPPSAVTIPADGRLRGDGFALTVLGVATGPATTTERAGPGQTLWVVGLTATTAPPATGGSPDLLTAAVTAGSAQAPLPLAPATGHIGTSWFLASVPASDDTNLTVTGGGDTETFSLDHLTRTGATPTVAYRDASNPTVTLPKPQVVDAPGTYTSANNPETYPAPLPLLVTSARLSYWAPDTPGHAAPTPGQAFLIVALQSNGLDNGQVNDGDDLYVTQAVPANALTLTVPGQPPIAATDSPGGGGDNQSVGDGQYQPDAGQTWGPFPDTYYYFVVPADLTAATLTVTPGTMQAANVTNGDTGTLTTNQPSTEIGLTAPTPAAFTPAANGGTAPGPLTRSTRTSPTTGPAAVPPSAGSSHGGLIAAIAAAAVVILLALGLALLVIRRRRTQTAQPPAAPLHAAGPATAPTYAEPEPWPPTLSAWPSPAPAPTDPAPSLNGNGITPLADHPDPTPEPTPAAEPVAATAPPVAEPVPPVDPPPPPARTRPVAWQPPEPPVVPEPAVLLLGAIRFPGWDRPPTLGRLIQLAALLAAATRPVPVGDLGTDLTQRTELELSVKSVRTYCSNLRVDHLPAGVELIAANGTYRLTGLTTDLQLLAAAEAAVKADPSTETIDALTAALALVSGPPAANSDYRWTHRRALASDVTSAARTLAEHTTNPHQALWGCHQSELAKIDFTVLACALTAAADTDVPGALTDEWERIRQVVHARQLPMDPTLEAHHRRLAATNPSPAP